MYVKDNLRLVSIFAYIPWGSKDHPLMLEMNNCDGSC